MTKQDKVKQKLQDKFGHLYDYSLIEYQNSQSVLKIIDKETGMIFHQKYCNHIKGNKPGNMEYAFIEYIKKCNVRYNKRYTYSDYKGYNKHVTIYDTLTDETYSQNAQEHYENGLPTRVSYKTLELYLPHVKHGYETDIIDYDFDSRTIKYIFQGKEYSQSIYEYLNSISRDAKKDMYFREFVSKANKIHNNRFIYKDYINNNTPITVVDTETGKEYSQRIKDILAGMLPRKMNVIWTFDTFKTESSKIHNNRFTYDNSIYQGLNKPVVVYDTVTCKEYTVQAKAHLKGSLPKELVSANTSKHEYEIISILEEQGYEVLHDVSPDFLGRKRLDIFLPELNIAIEFNGLIYHHSSETVSNSFWKYGYKDKTYHYDKSQICLQNGVKLIHIFDFEYIQPEFDLLALIEQYKTNSIRLVGNEPIKVNPTTLQTDNSENSLVVYKPVIEFSA